MLDSLQRAETTSERFPSANENEVTGLLSPFPFANRPLARYRNLTLPVSTEEKEMKVVQPMSAADPQIRRLPTDPKLIYVVDDEVMIGDVVQILLRIDGFKPRYFQDPEAAWQALLEEDVQPALLLTDFVMGPINGMQLIERCKDRGMDFKTILYSGNPGEEILQHYDFRPDAFLRKPFLPRALLGLVRSTLAGLPPANFPVAGPPSQTSLEDGRLGAKT